MGKSSTGKVSVVAKAPAAKTASPANAKAGHEGDYPATSGEFAPGCTCFYLRSATRRITQVYDDELRIAGLSLNQYSLLSRLSRHAGLSVSAFAERMSMDRTTLTRNLGPLEAAGWIVSAGTGGRARLLALTEAGQAKLLQAYPRWHAAQERVNAQLGAANQNTLHRVLMASIRSFEQQQVPGP